MCNLLNKKKMLKMLSENKFAYTVNDKSVVCQNYFKKEPNESILQLPQR